MLYNVKSKITKAFLLGILPCLLISGCKKNDDSGKADPTEEKVDTEAPKIEAKDASVIEGNPLEMDKLVTVTDNKTKDIKYSYKITPEIKDEKKLEVGEYEITVTAIDEAQNITSAKFKLTVKVDEVAAAKKKAEEEAKKKAEEEAKKKAEEEERARREAEEAAAAQAAQEAAAAQQAAQQQQQWTPTYTPEPDYSEPSYEIPTPDYTPSSTPAGTTQYYMFSSGYNLQTGYDACVAYLDSIGHGSCQPIMGADDIATGYVYNP